MVTLDNEEAKIVVGQNIPILTGSFAQTGTTATVTPFQTFDREDVGIVLHVKPQITENGVIKMQIYTESSSVVSGTETSANGATINKRSIQSTILSDDGQIIVLGGLIQDQYTDGDNKVPYLANIPVIGGLFRSENKSRAKTNLMVFLRPVIMRESQQSQSISLDRYEYMRAQTNQFQSDNWLTVDKNTPTVPALAPNGAGSLVPAERSPSQIAAPAALSASGPSLPGLPNGLPTSQVSPPPASPANGWPNGAQNGVQPGTASAQPGMPNGMPQPAAPGAAPAVPNATGH